MIYSLISPAEVPILGLLRIVRVAEAESIDALDKYPHPMFWTECDSTVTVHTHGYNSATQTIEALPPEAVDQRAIPRLPVIERVTRRQARLALIDAALTTVAQDVLQVSTMLDAVEAAIAAITDPVQRRRAQVEYEAETWEASSEFLQAMWAQLGGTSEQLAALFLAASRR